MRFLTLFSILYLFVVQPATAGGRHVLLIGNSEYTHAPLLDNPQNDTALLAQSFETLGYKVTRLTNLTRAATTRALQKFRNVTTGAEAAIIYFAGHGIEVDGKNYMVPVDAALRSDLDVEFEGIPLELVVAAVSGADGLSIVVLDACRDNPFAAQMTRSGGTRSIGRGLGGVEPTRRNQLVAYAAKAGTVAYDGDGDMSPYASAFNDALQEPGLDVSLFFRRIRDRVMDLTDERQEPFHYGSLSSDEVFISPPSRTDDVAPAITGNASTGQPAVETLTGPEKIARDFGFAQQIGTEAAWNSFLEKYGELKEDFYVKLALAALGTAPSEPKVTKESAVRDWAIFRDGDPQECWVATQPNRSQGYLKNGRQAAVNIGEVYMLVTARKGSSEVAETSLSYEFGISRSPSPELFVNGRTFKLFPDDRSSGWIWLENKTADANLSKELKRASEFTVTVHSKRGTKVISEFSAIGFAEALNKMVSQCKF